MSRVILLSLKWYHLVDMLYIHVNPNFLSQSHGGLLSAGSSGLQTTTSLPGGLSTYPPTPSPMPPLTPMTPMTAEQAGIVPQLQ